VRTAHAADLLDRAFASAALGDSARDLPPVGGAPPDLRSEICTHRSGKALLEAESEELGAPIQPAPGVAAPIPGSGALIASLPRPIYDPVPVFVGPTPGYQGPVAGPRPANTPIGAIAYAPPPEHSAAPAPIKPDPKALSMHRAAHGKQKAKHEAKQGAKPGVKAEAKKEAKSGNSAKSPAHQGATKSAGKPAAKTAVKPAKAANHQSAASSAKTGQN
jgi:D-alanyl-D-alanine carboxypeptidase